MEDKKLIEEINKRFNEIWNANTKLREAVRGVLSGLVAAQKITPEEASKIADITGIMVAPTRSEPIRLK